MKKNIIKKSSKKSVKQKFKSLSALNLNAAGIDIGSKEIYVAVPEDRDENSVRSFTTFTEDLHNLANWLKNCGIDTVAMESTGVYWIPLFQLLKSEGFEVFLVNARHVKNVPGRKSDVIDCQWLQQLHTYGLLSPSFQPDNEIRELRTYTRYVNGLKKNLTKHIQQMQKQLSLMNIQLHNVISDITGKSGLSIIRAIIEGERNPDEFVKYCDVRLKNPISMIKKSLVGNYTEDNIFALKQSLDFYEFYEKKINECEQKIEKILESLPDSDKKPGVEKNSIQDNNLVKNEKKIKNHKLHNELFKTCGVDLTQIDGLNISSVLTLLAETGLDMSKWETEKHFTSWLGLSSSNKITGGKIISSKTKKVKSRANHAFRMAAFSLSRRDSFLGANYRKLKYKVGASKATVAIARKIAIIYYSMLKKGDPFYDYGSNYYEEKYRESQIKHLKAKAKRLGLEVTTAEV